MSYTLKEISGVRIIDTVDDAIKALENDKLIGFDIETSGLNPWSDKVATVQLYGDDSNALALLHLRGRFPDELKRFLEKPDVLWIGHNAINFDCLFLWASGVDVHNTRYYDTMVMEQVITPSMRRNVKYSLKATLARRLGIELDKDIEHSWMNQELTDEQVSYAVKDVMLLPALYRAQLEIAKKSHQERAVEFELELTRPVLQMITKGIHIDLNALSDYVNSQKAAMVEFERVIFNGGFFVDDGQTKEVRALGVVGNLGSTVQLQRALETIGIKTKSTAEDTLLSIKAALHERGDDKRANLIDAILKYKHARQRVNTYKDSWIKSYVVDHGDGDTRIHARHRQCGADTGRFTVSDPNMQQIPSEQSMRSCFAAREGHKIITADYSGIEVCVAASLANDTTMLKVLETEDIHTTVASLVFDKPAEEVTKQERKLAKSMNFRLLFGGGVRGFFQQIRSEGSHLTLQETGIMIQKFFKRFPGLARMKSRAYDLASSNEVVWIDLPNGLRRMLVGDSLRHTTILNTPIQGTAGIGLKKGMILCHRRGISKYLVETVHDELVMEVPDEEVETIANLLKECMIDGMKEYIVAPVKVEVKISTTWSK